MTVSGKYTIYKHAIGVIPGISITLKTICSAFEIYMTI
jgi:hypothetical protein